MRGKRHSQPTPTSLGHGCMYACVVVTCHLHFWQNDRDLLHATALTRGMEQTPNFKISRTLYCSMWCASLAGVYLMTFKAKVVHKKWSVPEVVGQTHKTRARRKLDATKPERPEGNWFWHKAGPNSVAPPVGNNFFTPIWVSGILRSKNDAVWAGLSWVFFFFFFFRRQILSWFMHFFIIACELICHFWRLLIAWSF